MKLGEKFLGAGLYVLVISMFVYLIASGIAIMHAGDIHDCPVCAVAEVAIK